MSVKLLFDHPTRVPFDGRFRVARAETKPPGDAPGKKRCEALLAERVAAISDLQELFFADGRFSLLLVFQAMDAAGKDGTIRALLSGVNPAGCHITSFKAPSQGELAHDFLWRCQQALPERGRIGVFNRSWYEEVLAVRVHPSFLDGQRLPRRPKDLWAERLESIRDTERHLARNGTVILKFWLNVSKDEQRTRLLERIDKPAKHWKFDLNDVSERAHWPAYQAAYEDALNSTATDYAPWYAIPADDKPYMRLVVADIVLGALQALPLRLPEVSDAQRAALVDARARLVAD